MENPIQWGDGTPCSGSKARRFVENDIYIKLLSDKLSKDLGYVYENMVAQMLVATGHKLYYYTFPTEKGNHLYEVDFLISEGTKISPIEVKSSSYKAHKSLDKFSEKFSKRINHRYLIYTKDLRFDDKVTYLPVVFQPVCLGPVCRQSVIG